MRTILSYKSSMSDKIEGSMLLDQVLKRMTRGSFHEIIRAHPIERFFLSRDIFLDRGLPVAPSYAAGTSADDPGTAVAQQRQVAAAELPTVWRPSSNPSGRRWGQPGALCPKKCREIGKTAL